MATSGTDHNFIRADNHQWLSCTNGYHPYHKSFLNSVPAHAQPRAFTTKVWVFHEAMPYWAVSELDVFSQMWPLIIRAEYAAFDRTLRPNGPSWAATSRHLTHLFGYCNVLIASVLRRASVAKPLRVSALSKPLRVSLGWLRSVPTGGTGLRESANPKGLNDAGTSENWGNVLPEGGTAGRGVGKVEPGSEKILDVGLNFKIAICPAHSRLDVGLEKLRTLCEAYAKSIKRGHNKIHIWVVEWFSLY